MADTAKIYHERQRKHLCALHVLNNLLQAEVFTQSDLDNICTSLTPKTFFNPHRSMFGLGNYDVNVLTAALQTKNLSVVWFDKRKQVENIDLTKIKGVILNMPSGFLNLPFDLNFKHWIVLREIGGTYYNLDSKLPDPEKIGSCQHLVDFLSEKILHKKTEMLLVMAPEADQSGSWYHSGNMEKNAPNSEPSELDSENNACKGGNLQNDNKTEDKGGNLKDDSKP